MRDWSPEAIVRRVAQCQPDLQGQRELPSTLMGGDFTVDEIVDAIKRVGASKQLATSRNVATELQRPDRSDVDKTSLG